MNTQQLARLAAELVCAMAPNGTYNAAKLALSLPDRAGDAEIATLINKARGTRDGVDLALLNAVRDALAACPFTIEYKHTHSSEAAERLGRKPDRHLAMVTAPEFREDGTSWPKLRFVVECKSIYAVRRCVGDFFRREQ